MSNVLWGTFHSDKSRLRILWSMYTQHWICGKHEQCRNHYNFGFLIFFWNTTYTYSTKEVISGEIPYTACQIHSNKSGLRILEHVYTAWSLNQTWRMSEPLWFLLNFSFSFWFFLNLQCSIPIHLKRWICIEGSVWSLVWACLNVLTVFQRF